MLQIYSFFLKQQFFQQFFFTLLSFFLRERFTPPFLPSRNVRLERLEDLEGLDILEGLEIRDYEDSLARVKFIYHRNGHQWQPREPRSFPLEFYRVSGAAQ